MTATIAPTAEVVHRVREAYTARDARRLAECYTRDATLDFPGVRLEGRAAIADLWAGWFEAFPDVESEFHHVAYDGTAALLEWTERGTHTGPFRIAGFDLPATGGVLEWRGVSVYETGAGLVVAVRYLIDPGPLHALLLGAAR